MKISAFLTPTAISVQLLLLAASANANATEVVSDVASPMHFDPTMMEHVYPLVLADEANEDSGDAVSASDLPDYCFETDHDCFTSGTPKCCARSSLTCPNHRPRCDIDRKKRIASNDRFSNAIIGPGGYCNAGTDFCTFRYSCIHGYCSIPNRVPIERGEYCRMGSEICVDGYSCIKGKCKATFLGPGERCRHEIDSCINGYKCINVKCRIPPIPEGGECFPGNENCASGLACVDGICAVPPIPEGGRCRPGNDNCDSGLACINGICGVPPQKGICGAPPTGTCTVNCNCFNNDCAECTTNCSCLSECCELPKCTTNCLCPNPPCSNSELGFSW